MANDGKSQVGLKLCFNTESTEGAEKGSAFGKEVMTMEYGGVLHTTDRDFVRFPGLRWANLLVWEKEGKLNTEAQGPQRKSPAHNLGRCVRIRKCELRLVESVGL
jgi:hypothetical protein